MSKVPSWLARLNRQIVACQLCPRLRRYCRRVARKKKRAYRDWEYWGLPVPGFGDPQAQVLVLGLAPAAHGANRTGRMFTGDSSGNFLYSVLYQTGYASQPASTSRDDGLSLRNLYVTATARCAPPDNKPKRREIENCCEYLDRELAGLRNMKVVVALGKIAFDAYLDHLKRRGLLRSRSGYPFRHGARYRMPDGRTLLASYHPSQQNTHTGKLTRKMLVEIFREAGRCTRE